MDKMKAAIANALNELCRLREMRQRIGDLKEWMAGPRNETAVRDNPPPTLPDKFPPKIFLKDKEGIYVFCNENYARSLKIVPSEVFGKTDFDFFPEKIAERLARNDQWVLTHGQVSQMEIQDLCHGEDGLELLVEVPLGNPRGEVTGILGVIEDRTEPKRASTESEECSTPAAPAVDELQELRKQLEQEIRERQKTEDALHQRDRAARKLVQENAALLKRFQSLVHSMGEIRFV